MKTFLNSISTMRKSTSPSHSMALCSSNLVPYSGQAMERRGRFGKKIHRCPLCFHGIKDIWKSASLESKIPNMASVARGSSGWWWAPGKLSTNNYFSAPKNTGHGSKQNKKRISFPTLFSPPPDKCLSPSPQVHSFSWPCKKRRD